MQRPPCRDRRRICAAGGKEAAAAAAKDGRRCRWAQQAAGSAAVAAAAALTSVDASTKASARRVRRAPVLAPFRAVEVLVAEQQDTTIPTFTIATTAHAAATVATPVTTAAFSTSAITAAACRSPLAALLRVPVVPDCD